MLPLVRPAAIEPPRGELASKGKRGQPGAKERCSRRGVRHGERRAGLQDGNAAQGPAAQGCCLPPSFAFIKWQVVAVADDEAVLTVDVGQAACGAEGGFIIK